MSGIKPVFGGGGVQPGRGFGDNDQLHELFKVLKDGGCSTIDTAAIYGASEELLGKAKAGDQFTLDTKAKGGFGGAGHASKQNVLAEAENSKKMLGHDVDIYYLHAPDKDTPLEQTLEGVNEVYKKGFFKRFGVSNFKAEDVEKVYNVCKEKGYPLPSAYQGMNAFEHA
jgi:aryl-alcohol dehydrogenase-like predicted oxidoreductase